MKQICVLNSAFVINNIKQKNAEDSRNRFAVLHKLSKKKIMREGLKAVDGTENEQIY